MNCTIFLRSLFPLFLSLLGTLQVGCNNSKSPNATTNEIEKAGLPNLTHVEAQSEQETPNTSAKMSSENEGHSETASSSIVSEKLQSHPLSPRPQAFESPVEFEFNLSTDIESGCQESGGIFFSKTQSCSCFGLKTFSGWYNRCLDLNLDQFGLLIKGTRTGVDIYKSNGTMWDSSTAVSKSYYNQFSKGFEKGFLTLGPQLGTLPNFVGFKFLVSDKNQPELSPSLRRDLIKQISTTGVLMERRDGAETAITVMHVSSDRNPLVELIAEPEGRLLPFEYAGINSNGNQQDVNFYINELAPFTGKPFRVDKQESQTKRGCAQMCFQEQELGMLSNGQPATRVRVLFGGSLFRDWIKVWSNGNKDQVQFLATFTPSGRFALGYLKTYNTTTLDSVLTVYSSSLYPLMEMNQPGEFMVDSHSQLSTNNFRSKLPSVLSAPLRPRTVVCESGFSSDHLTFSILTGPNLNKSFFGWLNNEAPVSQGSGRYYSGLYSRNDVGGKETSGDLVHHAVTVGSNLILSDGTRSDVIPLGLDECLENPDYWMESILEESKSKIISISALDEMDTETCHKSKIANAVFGTQDKLLWVLGAGNDEKNLDVDDPLVCPVNLHAKNTIVVGSSRNGEKDSFSNYGKTSVHLFADGASSLEPYLRATSYATPRVSAVVSEIVFKYPYLSIDHIRRSILLSVDLDPLAPLPALSGGELNAKAALEFAKNWSKDPTKTASQITVEIYGNNRDSRLRRAFFKQRNWLE